MVLIELNLLSQEQTIEELKEDISANYTSFIQATTEIKRMENSVSQLKTLVLDCKRSIQCLKSVSLDISAGGSVDSLVGLSST